jgi:RHS repeat-associated protein
LPRAVRPPVSGFQQRTKAGDNWQGFRPFPAVPNIDFTDPNLRFIDLDGDGLVDLLFSGDDDFIWFRSLATEGFEPAERVGKPCDLDPGPSLVFVDRTESIYLADMSGDGLTDLVRIRNGLVCYWPNIGHGRFGRRVDMGHSPLFDKPDCFDQSRIRLADIAGTGTTDIIYFNDGGARLYFNLSGNAWSDPLLVSVFPSYSPPQQVSVVDLLGRGTACLVLTSTLPGDATQTLRYIDLTGGQKPYLLTCMRNNLGSETRLGYTTSTRFYIQDREAGRPWATRLPFPVHVVDRVETIDRVSDNRFVCRYAYHHGFYDGIERDFRGFGLVESWDTQDIRMLDTTPARNEDQAHRLPPVLTRTWYHTGADLYDGHISRIYRHEYWHESGADPQHGPEDSLLPQDLSIQENREARRALRGAMLRQETYALDGTEAASRPYSVSEYSYAVRMLQPKGPNRHAAFFTHDRETLDLTYERRLVEGRADPRISHNVVLAVDPWGTVTDKAAIGYSRKLADPALSAAGQAVQRRLRISWTQTSMTNAVQLASAYRAPVPCDVLQWEVLNVHPAGTHFRVEELRHALHQAGDGLHDLPFQDTDNDFAGHPCRRLFSRRKSYFRTNDLASVLPLSVVESQALPARSYALALTKDLVRYVYDDRVTDARLGEQAGYQHREGDDDWWVPSSEVFYSEGHHDSPAAELAEATGHFFLPRRVRDPYGNTSTLRYDAHDLLPLDSTDSMGNRVTAGVRDRHGVIVARGIDYRVLQPHIVMDANRNRSAVAFDVHGFIVATAMMGKPEEHVGDTLDGIVINLPHSEQREAIEHPLVHAETLLARASTRVVYDLFAYIRTCARPQPHPAATWTLTRETHVSDLAPGQETRIKHNLTYTDGFGRVVQEKRIAEPAHTDPDTPRWIGSGWTIFDNKGNAVRQYEPFFTATPHFEFDRIEGVSTISIYDPLRRAIAKLHGDHSWEKTVFGPWSSDTWDRNDTVLLDCRTDPDVGGYMDRLPVDLVEPTWYAARISGALGEAARNAAEKTALHAATPGSTYLDALGRDVIALARNRTPHEGGPVNDSFVTRTTLDIAGNTRAVTDALDRAIVQTVYDMRGQAIRVETMDSGTRWVLFEVLESALQTWDSRHHRLRTRFDALHRPVETWLRTGDGPEITVGQTIYGEQEPDPESRNLRGQPARSYDDAGEVIAACYDFKGNLLAASRRYVADWRKTPAWNENPALEPTAYQNSARYDAVNRPTQLVPPHAEKTRANCLQYRYDRTGMLQHLDVWEHVDTPDHLLPVASATLHAVRSSRYNARGQRTGIVHGNGAETDYDYDPLTFRLTTLRTTGRHERLLDLHYQHDPVGNICTTHDHGQQDNYFRNQHVEPDAAYVYDALYRLHKATGREHLGQNRAASPYGPYGTAREGLPQPGDGAAMARYVEHYRYDPVGNIQELRHEGHVHAHRSWTRRYHYEAASDLEPHRYGNRLSLTKVAGGESDHYHYDAHGNVTGMPHLVHMTWNWRDRLESTARRQASGEPAEPTYYFYDANGQRQRKVTERANGKRRRETLYLAGVEIDRWFAADGETIQTERETIVVMDGTRCIVRIGRRVHGDDPGPVRLACFQYANLLNSGLLELDDECRIISYEEYYPYGSTSYQAVRNHLQTPNRYRYAGRERDEESGFYAYPMRYYAPWIGRWTACDPGGLVDGTNLYQFAGSNPINNTDSNGMACDPSVSTCPAPMAPTEREEREKRSIPSEHPPPDESGAKPVQPQQPPPPQGKGREWDVETEEQRISRRRSTVLNLDLPPSELPASDMIDSPFSYIGYSVLYGLKQSLYKPINAKILDERPQRIDSNGNLQTTTIRPDRTDAALAFAQIAMLAIPNPATAEEALEPALMGATATRTTTSLENDITVTYGKTMTAIGDDARTALVADTARPWPGVHDVVVHAEGVGRRLTPGVRGGAAGIPLEVIETHEAQIAEAVLGNPNLAPGQPLRMLSCALNPEQAQFIADYTGRTVFSSPFVVGVSSGGAVRPVVQFTRLDPVLEEWKVLLDASSKKSVQVWNVFWPKRL